MKKKYFFTAFAAALLFAGFAFTACDDDDDNSAPGTKPTIKFENVIPTKNYVQSGTFAAVAPGATTSFTFHAAKGQRLMFAHAGKRHVELPADLIEHGEPLRIRASRSSTMRASPIPAS